MLKTPLVVIGPDQCEAELKPLEDDTCNEDACPKASVEASGDEDEEAECEYYDDWWIFGAEGSAIEVQLRIFGCYSH